MYAGKLLLVFALVLSLCLGAMMCDKKAPEKNDDLNAPPDARQTPNPKLSPPIHLILQYDKNTPAGEPIPVTAVARPLMDATRLSFTVKLPDNVVMEQGSTFTEIGSVAKGEEYKHLFTVRLTRGDYAQVVVTARIFHENGQDSASAGLDLGTPPKNQKVTTDDQGRRYVELPMKEVPK